MSEESEARIDRWAERIEAKIDAIHEQLRISSERLVRVETQNEQDSVKSIALEQRVAICESEISKLRRTIAWAAGVAAAAGLVLKEAWNAVVR